MQISSNTLSSISPNFTTPAGSEDYMNSEKNLKKATQNKQKTDADNSTSTNDLSKDEERLVKDLQARDMEVRAHESAHMAAGGGMTGAASYSYQQGPDGKMYAIGGQVSVTFRAGSTPEETLRNASQVIAAAMASSNPSPQDSAVASSARIIQMKAQQKLLRDNQEEMLGKEIYKNEAMKNAQDDTSKEKNTIDLNSLDVPA